MRCCSPATQPPTSASRSPGRDAAREARASRGRLAAASTHLLAALRTFPGYVYALDARAQVELARGHLRARNVARAARGRDDPAAAVRRLYGDLLHATGHERAARVQYSTEDGIRRLLNANGVRTDLETALFDVDHGIRLHASLALARKAQRERPSIDGDDVLAWALARNGKMRARRSTTRSSRFGSARATAPSSSTARRSSAASAATRAHGHVPRRLNPHFSLLWTSTLRRLAS